MKLYYSPAVCSLAPHIVLIGAGFVFDTEKVDLKTKKTATGVDYNSISDKSAVPLLVLDNGETISEGAAILQYLADQKPEAELAPKNGSMERTRLQEWLNYIATDMHKSHYPLFHKELGQVTIDAYTAKIKKTYDYVSNHLQGKAYLMGAHFSVADAYLFTVINWHNFVKIDLSPWPVLVDYQKRVAARPAVQKAMQAEGLL